VIRSEGLPTFNLGLSGSTRATFVLWQSVIHVAPTLCVPLITSFKPPLIAYPNVAVVQKVRIVHKTNLYKLQIYQTFRPCRAMFHCS